MMQSSFSHIFLAGSLIPLLIGGVAMGADDILTEASDTQKAANIKQMATALELYYASNNSYPQSLTQVADTRILASLPPQRQSYLYQSTQNGQGYVLGVELENKKSPLLQADLDGTTSGIDCADPFYCISM